MIGDIPDLLAKRAALVAGRDRVRGCGDRPDIDLCRARRARRPGRRHVAARGVGEGDRVAILTRNRIEFFEILFACAKLGAILVPLNWRMPPAELDGLIAEAGPALLFHGAAEAGAAAALAGPLPAIDLDRDYEACSPPRPNPAPARAFWPAGGDLVPALHVGHDRPAQGRDLHLPDGGREPRQYRRRIGLTRRPTRRSASCPSSTPPASTSMPCRP